MLLIQIQRLTTTLQVGYETLEQNTTGAGNTAMGANAMDGNQTGNSNTI